MYQTSTICDKQWNNIADDLISIHTYAQFFLLKQKCQINGVDFKQMQRMLKFYLINK